MRRKRRSGGQPGNQNARKHGFYSKVLTPEQLETFPAATAVNGVDREIALLRVKIRSILAHDPDNLKVLLAALGSMAGLQRARQGMVHRERRESKDLYRRFVSWVEAENGARSD
jgi:hypothetical protein